MTADVEVLPLPDWGGAQVIPDDLIRDYARANVEYYVEELQEEVARARGLWGDAETLCHKLYDQNAAQAAEIEALRAEVRELKADRDSWEQQASDRVADWHDEHKRAERLAEALRSKSAEWEAWGNDPDHPVAGCPQDERANEIFQRCANELRALLHKQENV